MVSAQFAESHTAVHCVPLCEQVVTVKSWTVKASVVACASSVACSHADSHQSFSSPDLTVGEGDLLRRGQLESKRKLVLPAADPFA